MNREVHIRVWNEREFFGLSEEWDQLRLDCAADPLFTSWTWMRTWWGSFSSTNGLKLMVLAAYSNTGDVIGLFPLCKRVHKHRGLRIRRLEWVGNLWRGPGTVRSELLRPLISPVWEPMVVPAFADYLLEMEGVDEIALPDSSGSSCALEQIAESLRHRCFVRKFSGNEADIARIIRLPDAFSTYLDSLGGKTRLRLFGRRKFLLKRHELRFENVEGDYLSAFNELNSYHVQRWGCPVYGREQLEFHLRICSEMPKQIRISRIYLDEEPVSILHNIIAGGREYNIQMGFSANCYPGKVSLGYLHLGYSIERAIEERRQEYNLLAGPGQVEYYKRHLAQQGEYLVTWHIIRPRWLAMMYRADGALKRYVQRLDDYGKEGV